MTAFQLTAHSLAARNRVVRLIDSPLVPSPSLHRQPRQQPSSTVNSAMTVQHIQQQIGQLQREANRLARILELTDRIAEIPLHPDRLTARLKAATLRLKLSGIYARMHWLEGRLPTPELLSERAYNRMIALGFEIEAAEAARVTTYREATHAQRHQRAA